MKWVLGFDRAKRIYDNLMKERIWVNEAGKKQILERLNISHPIGTQAPYCFSLLRSDPEVAEETYVNYRKVGVLDPLAKQGQDYDPTSIVELDGLLAALGRFRFRVCVAGAVDGDRVTINKVGVCVVDSYDFEGDQDLGVWDYESKKAYIYYPGKQLVTNADFRNWRTKHQRGGDFLVYSDTKVTALERPDTFSIQETLA